MKTIKDHIDTFSYSHAKKLEKLTEPLKEHFGINYFCYQKVNAKGQWEILGNRSDWLHHSADNQFYLVDPSLIDPRCYQSGLILPKTHRHEEFQNSLIKDSVELFNIDHPLAIVSRQGNSCEYYFFSAPCHHEAVYNVYLNKLNHLKKYIDYFKKETQNIREKMHENPIDIAKIKGKDFLNFNFKLSLDFPLKSQDAFLNAIGKKDIFEQLTPREKECLHYYQNGFSAKETAKFLAISYRTVEDHIENIKSKFHCRFKRELLKLPRI